MPVTLYLFHEEAFLKVNMDRNIIGDVNDKYCFVYSFYKRSDMRCGLITFYKSREKFK